jgi:DNA-3-methyladenine glycosylase
MAGSRPRPARSAVPAGAILPPSFYRRPTLRVARDLLGAYLVRRIGRTVLAGRIVEVEAYLGRTDPASHAYRGKSARNAMMFREGGHLYVYFTYGMHHCANVVTGRAGAGSAVLIRALEPVSGLARMAVNRGIAGGRDVPPRMLTGGPARLCQAMDIGAGENGLPLEGPEIRIVAGAPPPRSLIGSSPRIGISAGREKPWRFFVRGSPCLSRP